MSALGQKQTFGHVRAMSALPPKADMVGTVVMSALCQKRTSALFDHLVGASKQRLRPGESKRLGGLEIDDQLKLCRRLHWKVGRPTLSLRDAQPSARGSADL